MEIDKRVDPLKKKYTEDQVVKDNQKYIVYTLNALLRQYISHVRIDGLDIKLREFTKPVNDCSITLIARLITPQVLDIPKITTIIDWWITGKVNMYYDTQNRVTRLMYKDKIDLTEIEDLLVHLYNI